MKLDSAHKWKWTLKKSSDLNNIKLSSPVYKSFDKNCSNILIQKEKAYLQLVFIISLCLKENSIIEKVLWYPALCNKNAFFQLLFDIMNYRPVSELHLVFIIIWKSWTAAYLSKWNSGNGLNLIYRSHKPVYNLAFMKEKSRKIWIEWNKKGAKYMRMKHAFPVNLQ